MKPVAIKYDVGKDKYGRQVFLSRTQAYGWEIHVEAASQRDESQTIMGLTREVIIAMAEAVEGGDNA